MKEANFIKGKWYKNSEKTCAKCIEVSTNGSFRFEEWINYGVYTLHKSVWGFHSNMEEVDLSEIQEYLPENHPDKINIINEPEDYSYLLELFKKHDIK
jgi:hypothetical protein